MNILTINLQFSTLIVSIAARLDVLPTLETLRLQAILLPVLLLQAFLGPMFLAPGATPPGPPPAFAYLAAQGACWRRCWLWPRFQQWREEAGDLSCGPSNVEGPGDLLGGTALATLYGAAASMGPAYWIPAFWAPALLVTHDLPFLVLRKSWTGAT